jgi:uncharacterized protein
MFPITGLYAAALGILAVVLTVRVIILRAQTGISIMHGDNPRLAERIRQHGNLTESVPIALILLGLAEAGGATVLWMHIAGGLLLAGRLVHPFGINATQATNPARIAGQTATLAAIVLLVTLVLLQRLAT